ncbi:hypothetical protein CC2G_001654 [Coprinopsis cinerea AmutBmut pab1-1]|nr:hypothetical protein CC2G_001654 [Coprinopsis cinerea AmutBmut pab1-1]
MSTTNPSTSNNAGRSFGTKIKGVFEVIHGTSHRNSIVSHQADFASSIGLGENIRGTALAAIDSMSKSDSTKNDEIARQGRLELERGLTNLGKRRGQSSATTGPTGWSPETQQSLYSSSGYDRDPNVVEPQGTSTGYSAPGAMNRMPEPQRYGSTGHTPRQNASTTFPSNAAVGGMAPKAPF